MGKVMVIDLSICNGCYNCQIACKDEHVGNDWTPIAKPQPDTGQFWTKVHDLVRGKVAGRESDTERNLIHTTGLVAHDIAMCHYVYEKALEKGK